MIDIVRELQAIHRSVARVPAGDSENVSVVLRRVYPADAADVWDAVTDPDRLKRWFFPISGELKEGGAFQLEGNAGGDILTCDPPQHLRITFGGPASVVDLRLTADGADTTLELEHTVPIAMAGSGAGALFVGPGWDGGLLALGLYLRGEVAADPVAAANSPEGVEFAKQSTETWAEVVAASGTATAEEIEGIRAMAMGQYAPEA